MRIFLGLLGASLGVIASFYILSPMVGAYITTVTEFQSPDQAGQAYAFSFGGTILVMMFLGYFIGWFIGRRIERADDVEAL